MNPPVHENSTTAIDLVATTKADVADCKSYIDAIICIIVILIPLACFGTAFSVWYLLIHRPKKLKQQAKEKPLKDEGAEIPLHEEPLYAEPDNEQTEGNVEFAMTRNVNEYDTGHAKSIKTKEADIKEQQARRIRTLEQEKKHKDEKIQEQKKEIQKLEDENNSLNRSIKQLNEKMKELEHHLYPPDNVENAVRPSLAHDIVIKSDATLPKEKKSSTKSKTYDMPKEFKPINGLAILGSELLVFVLQENLSEIHVYDASTYKKKRSFPILSMEEPFDMVACKQDNCIYTIGRVRDKEDSQIFKHSPGGILYKRWPESSGGRKGRLSVYESNIIVCLAEERKIIEYNGNGVLMNIVNLSSLDERNQPWHALKVTSSHFVISHGDLSEKNSHGVCCILGFTGKIIKECTKWEKTNKTGVKSQSKLKLPISLAEDAERSIFVADQDSCRILLLNSLLKYQQTIIDKENGLDEPPMRLCFDETQNRLFVAVTKDWHNGRVLIFNVK